MIAVFLVLRDWIPCSRRRLPSVLATWCRPGLKPGNSHLVPGTLRPSADRDDARAAECRRPAMRDGIKTGCLSIVRYTLPSRSVRCSTVICTILDSGRPKSVTIAPGGPDVDGQCRVGQASLELPARLFFARHTRRHLLDDLWGMVRPGASLRLVAHARKERISRRWGSPETQPPTQDCPGRAWRGQRCSRPASSGTRWLM